MLLSNGIDTQDLKTIKILCSLKDIYSKIPETQCLNCPGKKTVEADCCKTFCPPMFYSEFANIMKGLEKKGIYVNSDNYDKKFYKQMLWDCIVLYLNPSYQLKCLHEKNNICQIYDQRPFSCRMFGLYSKDEWTKRLDFVKKELGVDNSKIPFHKQCKNIKCTGKRKSISEKESNDIYREILRVDVDLIKDHNYVLRGLSYNTFYSHFICEFLDEKTVKTFSYLKKRLIENYDNFMQGKITQDAYEEVKSFVDEVVQKIKSQVLEG